MNPLVMCPGCPGRYDRSQPIDAYTVEAESSPMERDLLSVLPFEWAQKSTIRVNDVDGKPMARLLVPNEFLGTTIMKEAINRCDHPVKARFGRLVCGAVAEMESMARSVDQK